MLFRSRTNAKLWGDNGVRLNCVAPGRMETAMLDGLLSHDEIAPGIEALPIGITKSASASNVANVVAFFLRIYLPLFMGRYFT